MLNCLAQAQKVFSQLKRENFLNEESFEDCEGITDSKNTSTGLSYKADSNH